MTSFFADVLARIDAIEVSKIVKPERRAMRGEKVVGRATPYLMRLHQVRLDMNAEANKIGAEAQRVSERLASLAPPDLADNFAALRAFANSDEVADVALRKEQLLARFRPVKRAVQQVDAIFWHEVRVLFPETEGRPCVYLNSDWQICWEDKKEEPEGFLEALAAMAKRGGERG